MYILAKGGQRTAFRALRSLENVYLWEVSFYTMIEIRR